MRLIFKIFVVIAIMTTGCRRSFQNDHETVDLTGTWKFRLDSANVGMQQKWFNKVFDDSVRLPGTTDEKQKGNLPG